MEDMFPAKIDRIREERGFVVREVGAPFYEYALIFRDIRQKKRGGLRTIVDSPSSNYQLIIDIVCFFLLLYFCFLLFVSFFGNPRFWI